MDNNPPPRQKKNKGVSEDGPEGSAMVNWDDILFIFHSPYSAWGLRYRASKLPKGDYRSLLEVLSKSMDRKIVSQGEAKFLVELARGCKLETAVSMLEKKIKNWKERT